MWMMFKKFILTLFFFFLSEFKYDSVDVFNIWRLFIISFIISAPLPPKCLKHAAAWLWPAQTDSPADSISSNR